MRPCLGLVLALLASTGCRQIFGFEKATVAGEDAGDLDAAPDAPPDVNVDAWTKRKALTVDGNRVTGTLTNFPMLVQLTDLDLASARDDGFDLLFTAADGTTKLAHEIERFDRGTGQLVAWVQLPTLPAGADTQLFLYFGNPVAANQQSAAAVWDANYVGVWHLGETTGTTVADSTAVARTGTKFAADKPGPAAAVIGNGQAFTGDDAGISIGSAAALDLKDLTIEMWVRLDTCNDGTVRRLIDFTAAFEFAWALGYPCGNVAQVNDNSLLLQQPTEPLQTQSNTLSFNQAHHLVFTGNQPKVFIDGVNRNLQNSTVMLAQDNVNTILGNRESSQLRAMRGTLDEVRISKVARSTAYIATSFANQQNPAAFLTVGPLELVQ